MTSGLVVPTRTLGDWQSAIAAQLIGGGTVAVYPDAPTPAGRVGWATTVALFRQWRLYRLRTQAPLTLRVLGADTSAVVAAYLTRVPTSTSYSARDADAFLEHVVLTSPEPPVLAVARLERAMLAARRPASAEGPTVSWVSRSRRADVLVLPYELVSLLTWACVGGPVPVLMAAAPILVAPDVRGWVRPATDGELALWCALERVIDPTRLRGVGSVALQSMIQAGAVVPAR